MSFKCVQSVLQNRISSRYAYFVDIIWTKVRLDWLCLLHPLHPSPSLDQQDFLSGERLSENPKGTLFSSNIPSYNLQMIEEGACYIAYDHWIGQHAFVTLWQHPTVVSIIIEIYNTFQQFTTQEVNQPIVIFTARRFTNRTGIEETGLDNWASVGGFRQVCQVVITLRKGQVLTFVSSK